MGGDGIQEGIRLMEGRKQMGEQQLLQRIIDNLNSSDPDMRGSTAESLVMTIKCDKYELYDKVAPHLFPLLSDKSGYTRYWASYALFKCPDQRSIDHLLPLINDEEDRVRRNAIDALGELRAMAAVSRILPLLTSENKFDRAHAVGALGKIGDPKSYDYIVARLNDVSIEVCTAALIALGDFGDPKAISHIKSFLNDKNDEIQKQATIALSKIDFNELLKYLKPGVDWRFMRVVGEMKDKRTTDRFISLLGDNGRGVKRWAIIGLEACGYKKAAPQIIPLLDDPDDSVRATAAFFLGKLKCKEALQKLKCLTGNKTFCSPDEAWNVRDAAERAIKQIEEK